MLSRKSELFAGKGPAGRPARLPALTQAGGGSRAALAAGSGAAGNLARRPGRRVRCPSGPVSRGAPSWAAGESGHSRWEISPSAEERPRQGAPVRGGRSPSCEGRLGGGLLEPPPRQVSRREKHFLVLPPINIPSTLRRDESGGTAAAPPPARCDYYGLPERRAPFLWQDKAPGHFKGS